MHPLKKFINLQKKKDKSYTQLKFAKKARIKPALLSLIINGKRTPSLQKVKSLIKATDGKLNANDFLKK